MIPKTAAQFKIWADRECGKWPGDLQVKAYNAWIGFDTDALRIFKEAYEQWDSNR